MTYYAKTGLLALVLLLALGGAGQAVVINEVLASNSASGEDPEGEYDDWIELHNPEGTTVNVGGMFLTDDPEVPTKWRIPAGTTIGAQGYLVVWADEDIQDGGLHASFKLSASGEEISLFDTDGSTLVDRVRFDRQTVDVSFGRHPDGVGEFRLLANPTAGQGNVVVYEGFVSPVKFSHERGFYDAPFEVSLSSDTPGAVIRYTVDGSAPFSEIRQAPAGTLYTGPILIHGTTCLRAMAFKDSWKDSEVASCSYLFLDQIIRQSAHPSGFPSNWGSTRVDYGMDPDVVEDPAYAPTIKEDLKTIPSVSILMNTNDLFDADQGIYANLGGHGVRWERAASMEWIDPVEGTSFQVNAGVRIHGSVYGRTNSVAKHSLRLLFKNEYGPSRLEYPLFEDSDVQSFESLVLRSIWNYSWFGDSTACGGLGTAHADYLRDQFARDTIRDMGGLTPHSRAVHVYLNGLYWGLFIFVERPDDGFLAQHCGGEKEDYDVLVGNSSMEVQAGDLNGWNTLMDLAVGNLSSRAAYEAIQEYLDVPGMIDYLLMIYYTGSRDAPVLLCNDQVPRNFYTARRREPASPFVFVPWDVEWILEQPNVNRVRIVGRSNPHFLLDRLMANADFRVLLSDHIFERFFNEGALTPGPVIERYMTRADEIDRAIVGESARWGDSRRTRPYTRDNEWVAERDRLVNDYFSVRTDIVLNQLRQAGFYPSISPPDFRVEGEFQRGGRIDAGDRISMTADGGEIWYTLDGSDPRVPGSGSEAGDLFTLIPEDAPKTVLVPTGPVEEAWRGGQDFDDSGWLSGTGGVGYEGSTGYEQYFDIDVRDQMYGRNASCYIRAAFTLTAEEVETTGGLSLRVRYDDGFVAYLNGVEVQRVLFDGTPSWDSESGANHSDLDAIDLEPFDLSAHVDKLCVGQNILAIHGLNAGAASSDFLISFALTATQEAADSSLEGVSATALRYSEPLTFEASTRVKARLLGGTTWSALNDVVFAVGPVAESLRISEIMYHPADPNAEYVELTNIGVDTINVNLVTLANGIELVLPSVELGPREYLLAVKDIGAFEAQYGSGLRVVGPYTGSLANGGERLVLRDAAGRTIHDFRFEDGWYGVTDGLGFSLTVKEPAAADANALGDKDLWRPSAQMGGSPGYDDSGDIAEIGEVVINELLANPASGMPDWIELHNVTDKAIDLGGWFLSDDGEALMKYEMPVGTLITAGGYVVFYEDESFGKDEAAGCHEAFGLSRNGETVYLHSGADGVLTGYSEAEKFDASESGVSLGRYRKSTGAYNFVALSRATPGSANADPTVGAVVITEVMYNPPGSSDAEYVELTNISDAAVTLYDEDRGAAWRFTDDPDDPGISLLFPSETPVVLAAGESLVLTKDPVSFELTYDVPAGVDVLAWGAGKLDNGSERIQLSKPGDEDGDGVRRWIRVDRVVYSDGVHAAGFSSGVDPWPVAADGDGSALGRISVSAYGNDPANWRAVTPSPGWGDD